MVDMNEQVISSSEEVTYETLDIVDCAVVSAAILEEDKDHVDYQHFDYQWQQSVMQNVYFWIYKPKEVTNKNAM